RDWREKKYVEKKGFRQCGTFDVVKNWHTFCVFSRDFSRNNALNIIKNADALIDKGEVLKSGRTAIVSKINVDGKGYVIKRYNKKSGLHQFFRCLMESRAAVSWKNGHLLEFNHIPTASPVLLFEKRWGICRKKSYILTEYREGIHAFDFFKSNIDVESKVDMAIKVTKLIHHFHQCCFIHGDLKAHNIWIARGEPLLIDLDGMKKVKRNKPRVFRHDWLRLYKDLRENDVAEVLFQNVKSNDFIGLEK
ncbi:MAG: hypothetical protein COB62_07465, partial [Piscirickettsiaceae bacterium]